VAQSIGDTTSARPEQASVKGVYF